MKTSLLQKDPDGEVLKHKLPAEHSRVLTSFVQKGPPTNSGSYTPASGQIG